MRRPRIYLSGKIAGLPRKEAEYHFAMAKFELQEKWDVVNPLDIMPLDDTCFEASIWAEYIIRDLMYLRHCEAIYMLEGWEDSPGAKVELAFAKGLPIPVFYENPDQSNNQ